MSQQSTTDSTTNADIAGDPLLLAESTPISDLQGFFQKTVVIGEHETGAIVSGGSVIRELDPGKHKVGWSFLGWGGGKKQAVKLNKSPFRLRLVFSDLLSKGYESLDGIIYITASISSTGLFYSSMVRGRQSISNAEVASTISSGVDDLVQVEVTATDGQSLRHDSATQTRMIGKFEPQFKRALEERGLTLDSVDIVAFNNPDEGDQLLEGLAEVDRMISEGIKPGREDIQGLLDRLRNTGLATKEMGERAQLLFDGGTNPAFFNAMKDISVSATRRLETQLLDDSERLSKKMGVVETATSPTEGGLSIEKILGFLVPTAALAGIIYGFIPDAEGSIYGLVAGVAAAVVFLASHILVRARRLLNRPKKEAIVIRLDRWAKRNSMQTDDLIRRQMGREFANAFEDVKNAKLAAHKQGNNSAAEALTAIENNMDMMRTEVESAPAASTIVSAKNFPTQRIYRMVKFEEELLRNVRDMSLRSTAIRESIEDETVDGLRISLEKFHRTFSKRLGLLEGFKDL